MLGGGESFLSCRITPICWSSFNDSFEEKTFYKINEGKVIYFGSWLIIFGSAQHFYY